MRREIAESEGQEVLFVGHIDHDGLVASVEVYARGSAAAVAAPTEFCERGDVVIHNHPSGVLRPSDADVAVAARLSESGIGSMIVDNAVEAVYVLVEPMPLAEIAPLDGEALSATLEDGGAMARDLPGFRVRPSQVAMLQSVVSGFNDERVVVAEAGTGVGKSFAYLIPAVQWAALNDERIVIATATINLQQQLVDHDLKRVQRALGTSVGVALVKGRGNYVCPRRLAEEQTEADLFSEESVIPAVAEWAATSDTGSRSELPFYVSDEQWGRINSEADSCAVSRCANRERCFILKARQRAARARILVANHHLVFSDLAVRQAGAGWEGTAILPPFQRLIFDEAHNLERAATSFFSESTSARAISRQLGRIIRTRGRHRFGFLDRLATFEVERDALARIEGAVASVREAAEKMNVALVTFLGSESTWRLTVATADALRAATRLELADATRALRDLATVMTSVARSVDDRYRDDPVFLQLVASVRRVESIAALVERFAAAEFDAETVLWLERRGGGSAGPFVSLYATPLEIRGLMQEAVFEPYPTVVMTSATLSVNGDFAFWADRLGVPLESDATIADSYPSPFDYERRVLLAVPNDAPPPESSGYNDYLKQLIARLVNISGGGALVLFTSYRQLEDVYAAVAPVLESRGHSCYRQGADDRSRLLADFREDIASVLFATDSFWEGVDMPGETLRLVILCRLPFRVPTDPIQLARAEAIEEHGGNAFARFSLPQAVMRLKQGFGRLMRRAEDYGVVVVADARMVRKSYGRIFWNSLPPARPFAGPGAHMEEEIAEFLARHAE